MIIRQVLSNMRQTIKGYHVIISPFINYAFSLYESDSEMSLIVIFFGDLIRVDLWHALCSNKYED